MREQIIEELSKDKDIKAKFDYYCDEFFDNYDCLSERDKELILDNTESIFKKFLYGAIHSDTYFNFIQLVNEKAQKIEKGDYEVLPHVKITAVDDKILFKNEFIFFSKYKHPVLEDMEKMLKVANPTIIMRDNNEYIIDNGEEIIKNITFNDCLYLSYILELCKDLGLLKEMKSIGCICFVKGDGIKEYEKLSAEEKIKEVIEASIKYSVNLFKAAEQFQEEFNREKILSFLDNNITLEDYKANSYKMVENIEELFNIDIEHHSKQSIRNLAEQTTEAYYRVFFDMYFTTIFGYFLGLIRPSISMAFVMKNIITNICTCRGGIGDMGSFFWCDDRHDLTPFGQTILDGIKPKNNVSFYKSDDAKLLSNDKIITYNEKNSQENLQDMTRESVIRNEKEIAKHLHMFSDFLDSKKKFKQTTIEKHCSNIHIFLNYYMNFTSDKDIMKINKTLIDKYMTSFYIPRVATSKTDTQDTLVSFGRYNEFLFYKKLIQEDEYNNIKKLSNDKKFYLDFYDENHKK